MVNGVGPRALTPFVPSAPAIVRDISPSAQLQTFLNDQAEPVQSAAIDTMIFNPEQIVSYISQVMTLATGGCNSDRYTSRNWPAGGGRSGPHRD
jgi:2-keto-4-pentenoate hydratase/2-oxohepta-3-ene-1,7-dioic acid hydratase in catechol pathway